MTLSPVALLSVLLVPALLGAALLRLQGVGPRTDPLAFGGWAWLQGTLALAIALSAWLWLGLPLRATWIAPALLALAGVGFALGRRGPLAQGTAAERVFPRWERLCFAAVLGFLLLSTADRILLASNAAIAGTDEALIWASKAKVLFVSGGFGAQFRAALEGPSSIVSHADYPPLNPLLQLWVFAHAGAIVHVENRLPLQAFGIAFVLVAASAARRRARPLVAALFLAALGGVGFTRFSMYHVYSDLLIAFGLLACWDLWQRFEEDGARVWLRLLGTSAPLLVWSKNEGLLLVLASGLALLAAALFRRVRFPEHRDLVRALPWALPLLGSLLYLTWFNRHFGLVSDLWQEQAARDAAGAGIPSGFLERALEHGGRNAGMIVARFATLIGAYPSQTRCLLLAFLVLAALAPGSAAGRGRMTFTLGLLLALAGYMAVYLGTHWDIEAHLRTSAHRLVYHLVPSAGLWVLLHVVEVLPGLAGRSSTALASAPP